MYVEADTCGVNKNTCHNYQINYAGSPMSCLIKIGSNKNRSLIDSGAMVSLISYALYKTMNNVPLQRNSIYLESVNFGALKCHGSVNLTVEIKGLKIEQTFVVVAGINRGVILGQDFLKANSCRIYCDLNMLKVLDRYVQLVDDFDILSVVRVHKPVVVKPQSTAVFNGKLKQHFPCGSQKTLLVAGVETNFLANEPGLTVVPSIFDLKQTRLVPLTLVNNTGKCYKLKRGCVIGRVEQLTEHEINSINVQTGNQVKQQSPINHKHVSNHSSNNNQQIHPLNPYDYLHRNSRSKQVNAFNSISTRPPNSNANFKSKENVEFLKDLCVPEEHREMISKFVMKNRDLFAVTDADLGCCDILKMHIDTGTNAPVKLRPYRTPLLQMGIIDQAVDDMLKANIIRPSISPWSSPVVLITKKDKSTRFCIDYRKLNSLTKVISYPLPLIDDLLNSIHDSRYFTSLDLKSGYWNIPVDEDSKEKTAFCCFKGLFEFNRMPYGLTNCPQLFSKVISVVLQGLSDFSCWYLDDILIHSKTLEEHKVHVQQVFDRLRKHDLRMKLKKCSFLMSETKYLGFVINKDGIKPDEDKVKAIKLMSPPTSVKHCRQFIAMCSYYRRFIANFSEIAVPIIELTKKYAKFKWTPECQSAFEFLKDSLGVIPLLAYPDPNKPYILYCDTSDACIGSVLTQTSDPGDPEYIKGANNEKPIYFLSHKLSRTQVKWSTVEKEAFSIHYALQKFHHYLHNAIVTIRTDHQPLIYLLKSEIKNRKVQLWALNLMGYNAKVEYVKGSTNVIADMLSRMPDSNKTGAISESNYESQDINDNTYQVNTFNSNLFNPKEFAKCLPPEQDMPDKRSFNFQNFDMAKEQLKDPEAARLIALLKSAKQDKEKDKYILSDDRLFFIGKPDKDDILRLYIPKHLETIVIKQFHDYNSHVGIDKCNDVIKLRYYFKNMYKKISKHISTCVTCQVNATTKTKTPLQQTDMSLFPMAKLGLDLSGPNQQP